MVFMIGDGDYTWGTGELPYKLKPDVFVSGLFAGFDIGVANNVMLANTANPR